MAEKNFYAFGGIRNTVSNERLELGVRQKGGADQRTDLVEAVNVDLDDTGRVSRRAGQEIIVDDAAHSVWAEDDMCLFVQGSSLKRLGTDYAVTTLRTGMASSAVRYTKVNDQVYWTNGTQTGKIVAGVARSWGIEIPLYPPFASGVYGSLTAGTYQYTMTFLRSDGQESGAGLAARIDLPADSGLQFSWEAPSDPDITDVSIYLSTADGEIMYQALVAPVGDLSATFTGGMLATPLNTQWFDAPPPGQDLTSLSGRIFIASGAFIYATTALGYDYVDMRDFLSIDNTTIRFVIGVTGGLYIGTEQEVYFARGVKFDEMELIPVVKGYGVAGSAVLADGFAITGDERDIGAEFALFSTELGICMGTPDGTVTNLTLDRYQTTMARSGAAVFRSDSAFTQYLLTMRE